eukprot:6016147-Pyramimonas_sp.AAC.1
MREYGYTNICVKMDRLDEVKGLHAKIHVAPEKTDGPQKQTGKSAAEETRLLRASAGNRFNLAMAFFGDTVRKHLTRVIGYAGEPSLKWHQDTSKKCRS